MQFLPGTSRLNLPEGRGGEDVNLLGQSGTGWRASEQVRQNEGHPGNRKICAFLLVLWPLEDSKKPQLEAGACFIPFRESTKSGFKLKKNLQIGFALSLHNGIESLGLQVVVSGNLGLGEGETGILRD